MQKWYYYNLCKMPTVRNTSREYDQRLSLMTLDTLCPTARCSAASLLHSTTLRGSALFIAAHQPDPTFPSRLLLRLRLSQRLLGQVRQVKEQPHTKGNAHPRGVHFHAHPMGMVAVKFVAVVLSISMLMRKPMAVRMSMSMRPRCIAIRAVPMPSPSSSSLMFPMYIVVPTRTPPCPFCRCGVYTRIRSLISPSATLQAV